LALDDALLIVRRVHASGQPGTPATAWNLHGSSMETASRTYAAVLAKYLRSLIIPPKMERHNVRLDITDHDGGVKIDTNRSNLRSLFLSNQDFMNDDDRKKIRQYLDEIENQLSA